MTDVNDALFDYVTHGNPCSTEHTKRYLRRYPQFSQEIVELAAIWRAISTIQILLEDTSAASCPATASKMTSHAQRPLARSAERVRA